MVVWRSTICLVVCVGCFSELRVDGSPAVNCRSNLANFLMGSLWVAHRAHWANAPQGVLLNILNFGAALSWRGWWSKLKITVSIQKHRIGIYLHRSWLHGKAYVRASIDADLKTRHSNGHKTQYWQSLDNHNMLENIY